VIQKSGEASAHGLQDEVILMHGAQNKRPEAVSPAELKELSRKRYRFHQFLHFPKVAMKPRFQLLHGNVRHETLVEPFEGKLKFRAKLLQGHGRFSGLLEDMIGRLQNGWQVIDQSA
jgi:hypothetical protein